MSNAQIPSRMRTPCRVASRRYFSPKTDIWVCRYVKLITAHVKHQQYADAHRYRVPKKQEIDHVHQVLNCSGHHRCHRIQRARRGKASERRRERLWSLGASRSLCSWRLGCIRLAVRFGRVNQFCRPIRVGLRSAAKSPWVTPQGLFFLPPIMWSRQVTSAIGPKPLSLRAGSRSSIKWATTSPPPRRARRRFPQPGDCQLGLAFGPGAIMYRPCCRVRVQWLPERKR
jgi:hypothetical protein